jgi:pyruvyltransferase
MYWYRGEPNLGDALAPVIVSAMCRGVPTGVSTRYEGKLLSLGSVLDCLAEGDDVWGTGAMFEAPVTPPRHVVFHAVRGPLTARLIRAEVPAIYGDPAMLLPRFHQPTPRRRYPLGIIPHLVEQSAMAIDDPGILRIDVRSPWRDVVDQIASCDLIISSSLHGLILAEAYRVPAIWTSATDRVLGGGFKFRDYYLSTERDPPAAVPWSLSLPKSSLRPPPLPSVDLEPLVRSFPESLRRLPSRDGSTA